MFSTAALTIFHRRAFRANNATLPFNETVVGVAALNLGGSAEVHHAFDCLTADGSVSNLRWTKAIGTLRFPTEIVSDQNRVALRLIFGDARLISPSNDTGIYTCSDIVTRENSLLNITESKIMVPQDLLAC